LQAVLSEVRIGTLLILTFERLLVKIAHPVIKMMRMKPKGMDFKICTLVFQIMSNSSCSFGFCWSSIFSVPFWSLWWSQWLSLYKMVIICITLLLPPIASYSFWVTYAWHCIRAPVILNNRIGVWSLLPHFSNHISLVHGKVFMCVVRFWTQRAFVSTCAHVR